MCMSAPWLREPLADSVYVENSESCGTRAPRCHTEVSMEHTTF